MSEQIGDEPTVRILARAFLEGRSADSAAQSSGRSPRSVRRYFKVFREFATRGSRLSIDGAEPTKPAEWSQRTYDEAIRWLRDEESAFRADPAAKAMEEHREEVLELARSVAASISTGLSPGAGEWLRPEWARPWEGPASSAPELKFERHRLGKALVSHLERLRFRHFLDQARKAAIEASSAASATIEAIPSDVLANIPAELRAPVVGYGVELAEHPHTDPPEICTRRDPGQEKASLWVGASLAWLESLDDSELAGHACRKGLELVRVSDETSEFLSRRDEANRRLRSLAEALEDAPLLRLAVSGGSCPRCPVSRAK